MIMRTKQYPGTNMAYFPDIHLTVLEKPQQETDPTGNRNQLDGLMAMALPLDHCDDQLVVNCQFLMQFCYNLQSNFVTCMKFFNIFIEIQFSVT